MSKEINARVLLKYDTAENWAKATFTPKRGEMLIYAPEGDTPVRYKIGDGTTPIGTLPFVATAGESGADGIGIASVTQTSTSTEDNGDNIVTVTLTNGTTYTFTVQNGSKGSQGDPGAAATVEIGSVTTGAAGSSASVTNSGTAQAAKLNFTIPQGQKGDPGDDGIASVSTTGSGNVITALEYNETTKILTATKSLINAESLGLGNATRYIGTSDISLEDGDVTNPITIDGETVTVKNGDIVAYGANGDIKKEFIWTGSKWEEFGNEGNYKVKQQANSKTATATQTIKSISQNENGDVTVETQDIAFPTSLPANGGNADTVDGKHAEEFATSAQGAKADNALPKSGGTMTGALELAADPTTNMQASTKQYVDNEIDNIHIGGRNLFRNTQTFKGWSLAANITAQDGVITWAATSTLGWNAITNRDAAVKYSDIRDKEVTISFEIRCDEYEALNSEPSNGLIMNLALFKPSAGSRHKYADANYFGYMLSDKWERIEYTFVASDSFFSLGTTGEIDPDIDNFVIGLYNYSLYSMQIRNVKLEKGNKATDWTPALEDMVMSAPTPVVSTDGIAYTATVPHIKATTINELIGVKLVIIPNMTSTSAASVTLDVNGLGAKGIKRWDNLSTSEWWSFTSASWFKQGYPVTVTFNGTYWIIEGMNKPYATDLSGTVPIANGGTGATSASAARTNLGLQTENWTFTLEDGSTVTKAVYVG